MNHIEEKHPSKAIHVLVIFVKELQGSSRDVVFQPNMRGLLKLREVNGN